MHKRDDDVPTLHVRCGSDLKPLMREAGFGGDYLEISDPICQGPVLDRDDWINHRAAFLADAQGGFLGRGIAEISESLHLAEEDLRASAGRYERIVLWFEHDSYDQLILARCLARFAEAPPARLEIVQIDQHPSAGRFIGLGQLPSSAFPSLWDRRQTVSVAQMSAGSKVWDMLRSADPTGLASTARAGMPELPFMAGALRRHCQEFPWVEDGLSLTERLILGLLSEKPHTVGEIFRALREGREPLPWLGDTMLAFIVESMKRVDRPVFTGAFPGEDLKWYREELTITDTGRAVLGGTPDFLSLNPAERYLGGVAIPGAGWRWSDRTGSLVCAN